MFVNPFKRSGALPRQIFTRKPTLTERVNEHPTWAACVGILIILVGFPILAEIICALTGAPN